MLNAVKLAGKKLPEITVVINGAGSAGIAIGKFLLKLGVGNLINFGELFTRKLYRVEHCCAYHDSRSVLIVMKYPGSSAALS